jgi:hypothetical protein
MIYFESNYKTELNKIRLSLKSSSYLIDDAENILASCQLELRFTDNILSVFNIQYKFPS